MQTLIASRFLVRHIAHIDTQTYSEKLANTYCESARILIGKMMQFKLM